MSECKFTPKQWVLVRDDDKEWVLCQFSHFSKVKSVYPYVVCGGRFYSKCIPYEGNEHLRGTTNDYVEPKNEPKYEPKDGDFVYIRGITGYIVIYRNLKRETIWAHAELSDGDLFPKVTSVINLMDIYEIRPATDEEKNQLLSKLHEIGKDWNSEKKEVVDWKWEPKLKERFFQPYFDRNGSLFICCEANWLNTEQQKKLYKKGWAFKKDAQEECRTMCDKLNAAIKNVK